MTTLEDVEIREKHLKHIAEISKNIQPIRTGPITSQERFNMVYRKDRLRQFHDIRNMKPEDLTRFQKMQLRDVKRQLYDFEMVRLRKTIFRTFDFTIEEKEEIECLINYPLEKQAIEMEVNEKIW
jgi:hypothetical protein